LFSSEWLYHIKIDVVDCSRELCATTPPHFDLNIHFDSSQTQINARNIVVYARHSVRNTINSGKCKLCVIYARNLTPRCCCNCLHIALFAVVSIYKRHKKHQRGVLKSRT